MPEGNREQPHAERDRFFLPRTELRRIQAEIDRIHQRAQQRGRLRAQDTRRLENLQGIKRRDFLKKAGVAAAGTLAVGAGALLIKELAKEREPKKEPVAWAKSLIERYNVWLEGLKGSEVRSIDATTEFLEMYNDARRSVSLSEELPLLSKEDMQGDLTHFNKKLEPLSRALEAEGYFLMASPTVGEWKGAPLLFMSILLGKVIVHERRETQKRGEKGEYDYIMIDKGSPNDQERSYIAAPLDVSALTFRKEGAMTVLQRVSTYRD